MPDIWNLPNPVNTAVFHWSVSVEAFGDGVGDQLTLVTLQQLNLTIQIGNQTIDPFQPLNKVINDLPLLFHRRNK